MRPIGRLVDVDHLVEGSSPSIVVVRRRLGVAAVERACATAAYSVSLTSVLLPEPDTPVTQVNRPTGISAVTLLQVVAARADDAQPLAAAVGRTAALRGHRRCAMRRRDRYAPGQRAGVRGDLGGRALRDRLRRRARRRRARGRRTWSAARIASSSCSTTSTCCRGRAGASACRSGARCRAGAARCAARRARTSRRSAPSRSATRAGCAAPRRPTACRRCGRGSGSRGPTSLRNFSRERISRTTLSAISAFAPFSCSVSK